MSMTDTPTPTPAPPAGSPMAAVQEFKDRLGAFAAGFSRRQRRALAVTGLLVVGMVLAVSWVNGRTDWAPLYTNLDAADAQAITAKLTEKGIDYQLEGGGGTIMVAKDAVYQTRVAMADVVLPSSGKVGYGILDNQSLATSEFGQRVGYQRAMEGELAKTIEAINGVQAATVHLALPRDQVFALDTEKPSASVMVKTGKGSLASEQVSAITNIVASAIEGMSPERVSVADDQGRVLASPGGSGTTGGGGMRSEAISGYQAAVAASIQKMLDDTYGPGRTRVNVSADLDLDQKTTTRETYEPAVTVPGTNAAMATQESTKTETYGSGATASQGVLGPTGQVATTPAQSGNYQLNERNVNYAVGRIVETTNQAPGKVNRLSVAVLVDDKAIPAEQVTALQNVVSAAAGIQADRGDSVVVSRQAFDTSVADAQAKELSSKAKSSDSSLSPLLILGPLALVMVAGLVFVILQLRKRKAELEELEQMALDARYVEALQGSDMTSAMPVPYQGDIDLRVAVPAGPGNEAMTEATLGRRRDERRQVVSELIDSQPDEVAQLLRGWLADRRAVRR